MTEKATLPKGLRKNSRSKEKLSKPLEWQEISLNRQTLVDILASWLYATRTVDEATYIKDIQVIDGNLSGKVYLRYITEGTKKESGTKEGLPQGV